MNDYQVAVIGSGPSGAMAAYYLAEKGISTVIIEKPYPGIRPVVEDWFSEVDANYPLIFHLWWTENMTE